jgi:hypothetical protein
MPEIVVETPGTLIAYESASVGVSALWTMDSPERPMLFNGNNLLFEAKEIRVERIERHLYGIEREAGIQHRQVNIRVLMAGEAKKPYLAIPLRLERSLRRTAETDKQIGIVLEADAVNLSKIEIVRMQTAQALVKHQSCERGVPSMGTDLGHEEDILAMSPQALSQPVLGLAPVVFPAVVEEGDSVIDRLMHDVDRGLFISGRAQRMAPQAQGRYLHIRLAESAKRDGGGNGRGAHQ